MHPLPVMAGRDPAILSLTPTPSPRGLTPGSIPPPSSHVATPAEWMPASSAGMTVVRGGGRKQCHGRNNILTRRKCSCIVPIASPIRGSVHEPSVHGGKTVPEPSTSPDVWLRTVRAVLRVDPGRETPSATHVQATPARGAFLPIWMAQCPHKTGRGESGGMNRQKTGCGAP